MVDPRSEREADLAHDLRPQVERLGCRLPRGERKRRPELFAISLGKSRKSRRRIHDCPGIYLTGKTVATAGERAYIKRSRRG